MNLRYAAGGLMGLALFGAAALAPAWATTANLVSGDDYPPFAGSSLVEGGVLTQLVTQAFAAAGMGANVEFKPWARGYEDTLQLEYDGTFPYLSTPRRATSFLFSDPLYYLNLRLYVRQDSVLKQGTEDELAGVTFCLPAGYEVGGWIRRQSDRLDFVRPRTMDQCHAMLQLGRVDVVISNPDELAWQAVPPRLAPGNIRELAQPLADVTLHLIVPRAHPQAQTLIDTFNAGLQQMTDSGAREQLFLANPDYRRSLGASD